ncbi:MAG: IMS domain-containing protein [Cyanobacteria bacterium J06623_7]
MRIPLDYYRILSVPVKATTAQLEQAYSDRQLQLPRREYSEQAIAARQQLIQYSYQVLSDSAQRASYDAQFLSNMQPVVASEAPESEGELAETGTELPEIEAELPEANNLSGQPLANPTIDISAQQIVGALLILHELGEYETVLSIGIDDFNQREAEQEALEEAVTLDTTQEDLVLVVTLAYMELGREQWHRREYENAALSGQLGINLLQQKSLFPHIQQELEQDLAKLRPYRVLELISQNPTGSTPRGQGFKLLQSMLLQRQGIEGKGEDRSGLNFDQFLCFVQQLRTYLTSAEQQELFDNPSQAESAIANYLAVYSLLGRGFSLKKPELVLRAQRKLDYLSEKQDVSWEQSIAALLLGHTHKAIRKLQDSPDPSQLRQVQQHSLGSSDLLPGLCFYGEQWLVQDVVAQFNDLPTTELTLKEYFADPQVQSYLEELAPAASSKTAVKSEIQTQPALQNVRTSETKAAGIVSLWRNLFPRGKSTAARTTKASALETGIAAKTPVSQQHRTSTATIERSRTILTAKRQGSSSTPLNGKNHGKPPRSGKPLSLPLEPRQHRAVPAAVVKHHSNNLKRKNQRRPKRSSATIWQGWLFIIGLVLGIGTIANLGMKLFLASPSKTTEQTQLAVTLDRPTIKIPSKPVKPTAVKPKLTFKQQSQQVIQTWLISKAAAFGRKYQIDSLNNILAEPLLTTWRDRAAIYQQENLHRQYEHEVTVLSATINAGDANRATVEAEVKEVAQHYQNGQLDQTQSYNDNLLVRYQLIRQGEKWLINEAEVLKTL